MNSKIEPINDEIYVVYSEWAAMIDEESYLDDLENDEGYTPRAAAYSCAIDWIAAVYRGHTQDLDDVSHLNGEIDSKFRERVRYHLAELYETLAHDAKLDGGI